MTILILRDGEIVNLHVEAPELPRSPTFMSRPLRYRAVCFCGRRVVFECRDCGYVPPQRREAYERLTAIDPSMRRRGGWWLLRG